MNERVTLVLIEDDNTATMSLSHYRYLLAERDRLRDDQNNMLAKMNAMQDDVFAAADRAEAAEAERDRLRDALRELIADCRYHLTLYRSGPLAKAEGTLKGDT